MNLNDFPWLCPSRLCVWSQLLWTAMWDIIGSAMPRVSLHHEVKKAQSLKNPGTRGRGYICLWYVCLCVFEYVSLCVDVTVRVSMYVYLYVHMCVCICVVCVCLNLYVSVYVPAWVPLCVHVSVCACTCEWCERSSQQWLLKLLMHTVPHSHTVLRKASHVSTNHLQLGMSTNSAESLGF